MPSTTAIACASPTSGRSAPIFSRWCWTCWRCRAAELLLLLELQRRAVHAIALAGGPGSVGEDVAEMAAALGAMHLGAGHEMAAVARRADGAVLGRPERWPARAAFVLGRGIEQRLAAAGAAEGAGALLVVQRAGERPLGAVIAQHVMLQRVELLLPLGVALLDGIIGSHGSSYTSVRNSAVATESMARSRLVVPASSSFSSRSTRSRASLRGSLQRA